MHVDHHPLVRDFPELRAQLQQLRQGDEHFARLAEEYEALDKRICRVEDGIETLDTAALGQLKQTRVGLKDDLARQLKRAAGQCCGCGNGCKG
ncbi:YdcH family protein [Pseudomonas sp. BMS12]|uniref:YdcH family protein n=1 Tax=Pseudomonas sp. BMS12 TaxID=1796033 RepID=UPI00083A08BA|nr:YdcH family protein [Pseudomonas sp. BMS12]